jgi:hypothetical protein
MHMVTIPNLSILSGATLFFPLKTSRSPRAVDRYRSIPAEYSCAGVKLNTYPCLAPRSKVSEAIFAPLPFQYTFVTWTGTDNYTFDHSPNKINNICHKNKEYLFCLYREYIILSDNYRQSLPVGSRNLWNFYMQFAVAFNRTELRSGFVKASYCIGLLPLNGLFYIRLSLRRRERELWHHKYTFFAYKTRVS